MNVYISYLKADEARVKAIIEALKKCNWHAFAHEYVTANSDSSDEIARDLQDAFAIINVWSKATDRLAFVPPENSIGSRPRRRLSIKLDDRAIVPLVVKSEPVFHVTCRGEELDHYEFSNLRAYLDDAVNEWVTTITTLQKDLQVPRPLRLKDKKAGC